MDVLFQGLLNASFYGSVVIAVVCLLRLLLKRAPKNAVCLLWLLVGLRLLMPFEIESRFSLQPSFRPVTQSQWGQMEVFGTVLDEKQPMVPAETEIIDPAKVQVADTPVGPFTPENEGNFFSWAELLPYGWLTVVLGMGVYSLVAYVRLKHRIKNSVILEEGIWVCQGLDTAFVLGLFRPQIYLPGKLTESEMAFVLAHERSHIARRDHWWKPLGYVAVSLHWFNPLVWAAYILLCRDLEMACDEAVVRHMELDDRKAYSQALVSCAAQRRDFAACPVAFGEVSVRKRIISVMNYKKPKFWIILLAVVALVITAVCFLTNPVEAYAEHPALGDTEENKLLDQCEEAVAKFQSQVAYHLTIENHFDGDYILNDSSYSDFYQSGMDWLQINRIEGTDQSDEWYWLEMDGMKSSRSHSAVHNPANGEGYDSGWVDGFQEGDTLKPWLCRFDWNAQKVTLIGSEVRNGKTYTTVEIQGDPYAGTGSSESSAYWVTFVLDTQGNLLEAVMDITESREYGIVHIISKMHQNTESPERIAAHIKQFKTYQENNTK